MPCSFLCLLSPETFLFAFLGIYLAIGSVQGRRIFLKSQAKSPNQSFLSIQEESKRYIVIQKVFCLSHKFTRKLSLRTVTSRFSIYSMKDEHPFNVSTNGKDNLLSNMKENHSEMFPYCFFVETLEHTQGNSLQLHAPRNTRRKLVETSG